MQAALFLIAFATVLFCIWGFFLALGPQSGGLLARNADREMWLSIQSPAYVRFQNIAAIVGPWVSFATVMSFYLGDAKKYGIFVIATFLSLFLSYKVTNIITERLIAQERFRVQTIDSDQVGAVIAKMFWSPDHYGQRLSRLIKIISLSSIVATVWLEFALLADFLATVMGYDPATATGYDLLLPLVPLFVLSFAVSMFTMKYGIRGFAFAELILIPIIAICFLFICAAAIGVWHVSRVEVTEGLTPVELLSPISSYGTCALFVIHVFAVNLFLPIVAENHWMRLWAFKESEIKTQKAGMGVAAGLAVPLVIAGWFIYYISSKGTDEKAMVFFVKTLFDINPLFCFIFWIAAVAALFSITNIQIYAGLIMFRFKPKTGSMSVAKNRPFIMPLILASAFSLWWYSIRLTGVSFDKLVFTIVPSALILLPALMDASRQIRPSISKVYIATAGYWGAAVFGLISPAQEIYGNLGAAIVPVIVSMFPVRRQ